MPSDLSAEVCKIKFKSPSNFPVSGKDLLNIGFKEGKEVGEKLNEIRDWWISKGCKPSHKECLSKAIRS